MFISKNTNFDALENIKKGEPLLVSKDIALNAELLELLLLKFPDSEISIASGYDFNQTYSAHDTLYSEEETVTLVSNVNMAQEKYGKTILFDKRFTVQQAISASKKINDVVAEINRMKLSPFEKFVYAYQYVTNRCYTEEGKGEEDFVSRNLVSILNGDKIVCVGYANMLATILNRVGVPCTTACVVSYSGDYLGYVNHAICSVRMVDPKYKIDGIYASDPTADAAKQLNGIYGNGSFNFALTQLDKIEKVHEEQMLLNRGLEGDAFGIKTFEDAKLFSVYVPIVMSHLFPEKTGGRPQTEIIQEMVEQKLDEAGIYPKIGAAVDGLSEQDVEHDLKNYITSIFDVSKLYTATKQKNYDVYIENLINNLYYMGYSNEQILEFAQTHFSEEKISAFVTDLYQKKFPKMAASLSSIISKDIEKIKEHIAVLPERLALDNPRVFEEALTDEASIARILKHISDYVITQEFYQKDFINETYAGIIKHLEAKGFSLEQIKFLLKSKLETFDASKSYLETDDRLTKYSVINERELYSGYPSDDYDFIYNEPYEEDYDRLSKSAPFVNQFSFFKACQRIFLSQGFDFSDASDFAGQMMRNTDRVDPTKTFI